LFQMIVIAKSPENNGILKHLKITASPTSPDIMIQTA